MPVFNHAAFKSNVDLTALKIVELIEKIHEMTPDSDERHSLLNDMVQIKDKIHFVDKLPNPNEAKQIILLTRYYRLYISLKQSIIQARRKTYGNPQIKPLLLEADVLCRKVLVYLQKLLTELGQSFDPIPKMTDATFTRGWMPQRGTRRGLQPPPAYRHQRRTRSRTRSRSRSGTRSRSSSRHSTGTASVSPFESLNGSPDQKRKGALALRSRRHVPYGYERGSDPNLLHQRRHLEWATPPERGYSA